MLAENPCERERGIRESFLSLPTLTEFPRVNLTGLLGKRFLGYFWRSVARIRLGKSGSVGVKYNGSSGVNENGSVGLFENGSVGKGERERGISGEWECGNTGSRLRVCEYRIMGVMGVQENGRVGVGKNVSKKV